MLEQRLLVTGKEALQRRVAEAVALQVRDPPEAAPLARASDAEQQRAAAARRDELAGKVRACDDERVRALQAKQHLRAAAAVAVLRLP